MKLTMVFLLLISSLCASALDDLSDYRVSFKVCRPHLAPDKSWYQIRSFKSHGKEFALIVDKENLQTEMRASSDLDCSSEQETSQSKFSRLHLKAFSPPYPRHNDGVIKSQISDGFFITIDLCPSLKGKFETDLIENLKSLSLRERRPIPIAFAVTGDWLKKNLNHFTSLLKWEEEGYFKITWINHTNHHFYDPQLPAEENFLVKSPWPLESEILSLEKVLIEHGVTPSIFFRFPGLLSNESLMGRLKKLYLIPIGSDSWMAKKQTPKKGSIILVHGNGNETHGVKKFKKWLSSQKQAPKFLSFEKDLSFE
jgi:hypothetical protein